MEDIDKKVWKYLRQSFTLIAALSILLLILVRVLYLDTLITSVIVGTCFALVIEVADILIWRKVSIQASDMLPMFFLGVSGVRLLLTLGILLGYYLMVGGESMINFFCVIMVYYIVVMAHHTLFFQRTNNHSNEKNNK